MICVKSPDFLHERDTLRDTKMPDCKYLIAGIKIFFGIKYPLLFPIGVFLGNRENVLTL